jgi:3-hydroxyisobutyrate dehydrogenase-like beta-hydroxyacid dehydrogenase
MEMKPIIGVIGLGIMGSAMANALIEAGYKVVGTDIRSKPRQQLKRAGGRPLTSSAAVAGAADVLIVSLATVAALDAVVAEIASRKGKRGLIVIETSTLPIDDKMRAMQALKRAGTTTLDCPISGTARRMKEGGWTIFVSGPAAACKKVAPIFAVFTKKAPYVGAFGNGSKMKFIANHLVAIYNVSVAESLIFARKMGLNAQQVWELFAPSPVVGTGVYKMRGKFMVDRKYLPATMKVEVWQKDMQVIGDMARMIGAPVPLFSACLAIYNAAMAQGLDQHDTASVHEVLAVMAGDKASKR